MEIVIVGGGLSGLTLAYLLKKKKIPSTILEASFRLGGRIDTVKGVLDTPLELGATWFSDIHTNLNDLMIELEMKKYPQFSNGISLFQTKSFEPPQKFYVPASESPSYRIVGGTYTLINKLTEKIGAEKINLNTKVLSIKEKDDKLIVVSQNGMTYKADKVILCIPPQLVSRITFSPKLPKSLKELLPTVQTWMEGSIKFVLEYEISFWREMNYSGMLYSHTGIIREIYDHTNYEENKFGFTGFLNNDSSNYPVPLRKELVLRQLVELFGDQILNPVLYKDKIWVNEFITEKKQLIQHPHQNNGHPLFQESYFNEKLFFAGTETATEFPGYMEGAIISAKKILNFLT